MGRAVVVHETGAPEVLRLEEHDPGEPGVGQVRVRIAARFALAEAAEAHRGLEGRRTTGKVLLIPTR